MYPRPPAAFASVSNGVSLALRVTEEEEEEEHPEQLMRRPLALLTMLSLPCRRQDPHGALM